MVVFAVDSEIMYEHYKIRDILGVVFMNMSKSGLVSEDCIKDNFSDVQRCYFQCI